MNWTFGVTTTGMAGWFGAVDLGVVAIRTRRELFRAAQTLRKIKPPAWWRNRTRRNP